MSATGHPPRSGRSTTSANMAPSTSTLSASGSRKAPARVVPWRRAIQPSTPSVLASTIQSSERGPASAPSSVIMTNSSGETSRRMTVTALAGVARADGAVARWRRSSGDRAGSTGARSAPRTSAIGPVRHEVGTERIGDRPRSRTYPPARSSGTVTMPSISGASRCVRARPGASTRTSTVEPIRSSRRRRGDAVLQLAQLGEALGHQRRRRPRRRGRRRRCRPRASRRRSRTSRAGPRSTKSSSASWSSSVSPG